MGRPFISRENQNWNDCEWVISFCGIFCNWQEGSEATSQISGYLYEQEPLFNIHYVPILWHFPQRLLWLCESAWTTCAWSGFSRYYPGTTRKMRPDLWIPADVGMVEKGKENISRPENDLESYEEIRTSDRDSSTQEVEPNWTETPQIWEFTQQRVSGWPAKPQMGHGYFLYFIYIITSTSS